MSRADELQKSFEEKGYFTDEEVYELLILERGAPSPGIRPDAAYAERYRGRVPDFLIRLWLEYGWGSWHRGGYWLCDPGLLQPLLDSMFAGDPDYNPSGMTVFGYNAVGELDIWLGYSGGYYRVLHINWLWDYAVERNNSDWNDHANIPVSADQEIINRLDGEIYENDGSSNEAIWRDDHDEDVFPRALARLGELSYGEIYGFVPALSMGGANEEKNLQRVPVLEHLMFLWQVQRPMLERYDLPKDEAGGFGTLTPIRRLGHAE